MPNDNTDQSTMINRQPLAGRPRHIKTVALGILLAALLVRVVYIVAFPVHFRSGMGCFGDTSSYLALAYNLNEHNVYSQSLHPPRQPSVYKPPLYPFFLAGLLRCGITAPDAIRIVQGVLGSLASVFVFLAAWWLTGRRADAVVAGLLAAVCPYTIHYTRNLLSDWLGVVMFAAFLAVTVKSLTRLKLALCPISGLLLGLTILVRPAMAPLLLVVISVYALGWRDRWRRRFLAAGLAALACVLVIGIWTARNYRALGRFVPVSAGGLSVGLLRGTWETAGNWSWSSVPREYFNDASAQAYAARLVKDYSAAASAGRMEELFRLNKDLRQLAFKRMREHPLRYLALCVGRLPILWWNHHINMYHERDPRGAFIFIYLAGWLLALPTLRRQHRGAAILVMLVPIYITLMHIPAHCEPRFTLPALPALCIMSGQGFAASYRFLRSRLQRS